MMRFTPSCVSGLNETPLTSTLRISSWTRSTCGFCVAQYGSVNQTLTPRGSMRVGLWSGSGRQFSIMYGSLNSGPLSVSMALKSATNSAGPATPHSMLNRRVVVCAVLLSRRNASARPVAGKIIV